MVLYSGPHPLPSVGPSPLPPITLLIVRAVGRLPGGIELGKNEARSWISKCQQYNL